MSSFGGFPAGKTRFTPIPDLFFVELLPAIEDPGELKLTLFMFWFLNRQRGYPRYMTLGELEAEGPLLSALACSADAATAEEPQGILRQALDRAVDRGTLLRLRISDESDEVDYFFLNTAQGRKAVDEVRAGSLVLETTGYIHEAHIVKSRPNIFELYEQNIGLLQPILAEELQDAQGTFPSDWIADAFQIAAEHNARSWRYIRRILERQAREGRDQREDKPQRRPRHRSRGSRLRYGD